MDDDVKPLSRLEKESKHSNMLLPTGDLPKLPCFGFSCRYEEKNWLCVDVVKVQCMILTFSIVL